jgi:hypothetical protein
MEQKNQESSKIFLKKFLSINILAGQKKKTRFSINDDAEYAPSKFYEEPIKMAKNDTSNKFLNYYFIFNKTQSLKFHPSANIHSTKKRCQNPSPSLVLFHSKFFYF